MNRRLLLACLAASLLTGCAVKKEWQAVSGSRADATVSLAYEYTLLEQPQEDMAQGGQLAQATCKNWGYTNASPFAPTRNCEQSNDLGNCLRWKVTRNYQCTGPAGSKVALAVFRPHRSTSFTSVPASSSPYQAVKRAPQFLH